jgi:hypothetical protein
VEWLFSETLGITLQLANKRISHRNWELQMVKLYEQAKEMEKQETTKFTIGYFNWLHNNGYKYNPKVKMYWKMMINETLFFTIEELMIEFNKIQGGEQ